MPCNLVLSTHYRLKALELKKSAQQLKMTGNPPVTLNRYLHLPCFLFSSISILRSRRRSSRAFFCRRRFLFSRSSRSNPQHWIAKNPHQYFSNVFSSFENATFSYNTLVTKCAYKQHMLFQTVRLFYSLYNCCL